MDQVRIGIVGAKFAADFHCDCFARNPKARVAAIASPSGPEQVADKWQIPERYTDYRQMLESPDIDLISICAPNSLHHQVALDAARAGKHVIVEKPLATTSEQAREMLQACQEAGVLLMYAEDWCFTPALVRAKEIVDEGGIGEVLYVKAKEVHNGTHSPYAKNRETCGGGSFIHLGIHPIGWLLHFLGGSDNPVVEVTGKMNSGGAGNFVHTENGGEDFGMGMMRFKGGQFAFVEGNYITTGGMDDKVEIYGNQGVLKIDLTFGSPIDCYSRGGISYAIEKTDFTTGWTKPAVDEFHNLGYAPELNYFVDCARGEEQPFYGVDGKSGLACIELVEAFYRSNDEARSISGSWA